MIKLSNITKIFTLPDKKLTALDNVSMSIPKGQICGVIGASGAGKSTLIRCVNLLEKPSFGSVVVDGVDLTQLSGGELVKARRQIGMIFQCCATVRIRRDAKNKNSGKNDRTFIPCRLER